MTAKKRVKKAAARKVAAPKAVNILINGQATGQITPEAQTIAEVANQVAKEHGLKSYSILVNGTKVTTENANKPLAGATSLEVFAKETRGSN